MAAEKHNQVLFKVLRDATKPEIKAAVELMFKVDGRVRCRPCSTRARSSASASRSAGVTTSRRPTCRWRPGQELNFSGEGAYHGRHQGQADVAGPACGGEGLACRTCTRAGPKRRCSSRRCQNAGRNNNGHITTRHKGGGHKHHYRVVDFVRNKDGIPAKVERIEYDPNRTRPHRAGVSTPTASAATSSPRAAWKSARRC